MGKDEESFRSGSMLEMKRSLNVQEPKESASILVLSKTKDGRCIRLANIVRAIDNVFSKAKFCKIIEFSRNGCLWHVALTLQDPKTGGITAEKEENGLFCVYATCTKEENPNISFSVDIIFVSPTSEVKNKNNIVMLYNEEVAQEKFRLLIQYFRKDLARLEFPNFPNFPKVGNLFKSIYYLHKELNHGSYATVFLASHRKTNVQVAVKVLFRKKLTPRTEADTFQEVAILSNLNHPRIVKVIDFFDEPQWLCIVMEYLEGGDVFEKLGRRKSYNENDTRALARSILLGLRQCHEHSVAHLDLKTKNLLLPDHEGTTGVKITDFGFSERVIRPYSLTRQCGTPFFTPPEIILKRPYDERTDMWSFGIIVYSLLYGYLPFEGKSIKELFMKIVKARVSFSKRVKISDEAKEFIKHLLVRDPNKRWDANQALRSDWIKLCHRDLSKNDLSNSLPNIKFFNAKLKLKSAMLAVRTCVSLCEYNVRHIENDVEDEDESDDHEDDANHEDEHQNNEVEEEFHNNEVEDEFQNNEVNHISH